MACFALACSKEGSTNKMSLPPESSSAPVTPGTTPSADGSSRSSTGALGSAAPAAGTANAAEPDVCTSPCLLLGSVSYEKAGAEYCARCGKTNPSACDGSWPSKLACEENDKLRNCIYASYGRPFKKKKWQETFGKLAWYRPDPSYSDARLSPIAAANAKTLAGLMCARASVTRGGVAVALKSAPDGSKEFSYDLDGDGTKDKVRLTPNRMSIGNASTATTWGENGTVVLVDLQTSDKRTEFALVPEQTEDDATYQIYAYEHGSIVRIGDVFVGGGPTIPGDGTMRVEKGSCGEDETETWQLRGNTISRVSVKKSGTYDPKKCAACPYVFSEGADGRFEFRGKVARNLVGRAASAWQSVSLPAPRQGSALRVRIVERESERSSLEEVFVKVDGVRRDSVTGARNARLDYGDDVEFVFDGPFAPGSSIELWAKGYYEPYTAPLSP